MQADGADIRTVEGLSPAPDRLSVLQEAFREHHGLQCGFCTAGILMSLDAHLRDHPDTDERGVREVLSAATCAAAPDTRPIIRAALAAAARLREAAHA